MKRILAAALVLGLGGFGGAASAHGPEAPTETTTKLFNMALPNAAGKAMLAVEVVYQPGGVSPAHTHAASAFIFAYVLEGQVESAVDDEAPRTYGPGESWHELPGAHHRVSRNASKTRPARILAVFVADEGVNALTFPDKK